MLHDDANPYRPAATNTFAGDRTLFKPWAKWVLLVLGVLSVLTMIGGIVTLVAAPITHDRSAQDALFVVGFLVILTGSMMMNIKAAIGLYWLYQVWSWLPPEQRYTRHWKNWITPGAAALFLLIPYFNYYWIFVINCGLCDALDRMRVAYKSDPAPKGLAIAACVCQLVAFPVAPFVWFAFMNAVDRSMAQMMGRPSMSR
jgi:hypothetical protein